MQWFISLLADWAAQLSGVTNVTGAVVVALLAAMLFALSWHRRRRKEGKPGVEPHHLIFLGLAGMILCAGIAFAGFVWQSRRPAASAVELGALSAKVGELQSDYERYVRPRRLTEEQGDIIINFLLDRKPPETVHILHYFPDDEAMSYAAQIQGALAKADWKTSHYGGVPPNLPREDRTIIKPGITFFVEYTPTQHENSRALRLLEDAFQAAGVQTRGMGSWTNPEGTEQKLYLCVGPRSNS